MKKARFDEYFAKVVLEYCFPERYSDLQIFDKPDLQSGQGIGIEVTNCMPQNAVEAIKLWQKVEESKEPPPPRILERLEQLNNIVYLDGNDLIWEQAPYINDDIENSPINDFIKAVEKKVERLNSVKACYEEMDSYELFVNSAIEISMLSQINAILDRINKLNNNKKKFNRIYLIAGGRKLIMFDMVNKTFYIKHLYPYLERIGRQAIKLFKGQNNE